jgi:dipeptidase E
VTPTATKSGSAAPPPGDPAPRPGDPAPPAELDLRGYFGQEQRLRGDLAGVALAWLRGGSVFMLRFALFRSAGDVVFRDLLAADALVYAGYSAGACVLSSTLRGLELVDDAGAVMRVYGSEPVWDGLALLKIV